MLWIMFFQFKDFSATLRGTIEIEAARYPGHIKIVTDIGVITVPDQMIDCPFEKGEAKCL